MTPVTVASPASTGRIDNFERWRSRDDLDAWRAVAHAPDVGDVFLTNEVRMVDAAGERSPFDRARPRAQEPA